MKVVKGQPFIGRSTSGGSVLILALEEHPRDVRMRLQALGLQESDKIFVRVESVNPTRATLAALCKFVVENGIKLVVIDTLSALWRSPMKMMRPQSRQLFNHCSSQLVKVVHVSCSFTMLGNLRAATATRFSSGCAVCHG